MGEENGKSTDGTAGYINFVGQAQAIRMIQCVGEILELVDLVLVLHK